MAGRNPSDTAAETPGAGRWRSVMTPYGGRGFTLVELLVVIVIILILVSLTGAAVSSARSSVKRQQTQALIAKIDAIVSAHFATVGGRSISAPPAGMSRDAIVRRQITADLPDSPADAQAAAANPTEFPSSPARAYAGVLAATGPSGQFADAECLFMIVMQGGIAGCVDCSELSGSDVGDKDGDKAPEFLDAWGNPIRYILWPGGLELPVGKKFFQATPPLLAPLRPLIWSMGPDGKGSLNVNAGSNLGMGASCGDPANATVLTFGAWDNSKPDCRADNITNLDAQAVQ